MRESLSDLNDDDLLHAFRRGNAVALEMLVERHQRALHGYLRAMTGNAADADDVFQDTWLRVVRNPGSFRGGAFNAWLWCIARNLLVDRIRRRKPVVSLDDAAPEHSALIERMPADGPAPTAALDASEIAQQVAAAVSLLPPDQRDVFLLRTQGGLSFAEIAALRRVPLNTALGRMHYAIQRLRKLLGPAYAALGGAQDGTTPEHGEGKREPL